MRNAVVPRDDVTAGLRHTHVVPLTPRRGTASTYPGTVAVLRAVLTVRRT